MFIYTHRNCEGGVGGRLTTSVIKFHIYRSCGIGIKPNQRLIQLLKDFRGL